MNTHELLPPGQGKILWVSGRSGSGKSTVGGVLREKHGFIHYEGDAFIFHHDPFSGPMYQPGKKPILPGIPREQKTICKRLVTEGYMPLVSGRGRPDFTIFSDFYDLLCKDILEKKKTRRNDDHSPWAITNALYTRECRDYIRTKLGSDSLIIISLKVTDELAVSRMALRAGVPESARHNFKKYLHGYEDVAGDEPNTYEINISEDMRPDAVCRLILSILEKA